MAWPFSRKIEVKENPVGAAFIIPGGDGWTAPAHKREYITEGYQLNAVVYRAVNEITRACADLEVEVVNAAGDVLTDHPALDLLAQPNPMQGNDAFIRDLFTSYLLLGEMAAARSPDNGKPVELWPLSPLYIKVEPGAGGIPLAYVYEQNAVKRRFQVDRITGLSQLFFMKMTNPNDYWRGQSPLMAAGLAADTHNAGVKWNYKLLRNSARPSGLIKLDANAGGEVVARIREWFKRAYQGEAAAGEVPMLPVGAEWVPMDTSPRDMDFNNTLKEAAKLIASVLGVPLPLIDNDASTFNNLEQAKERFYTDTVIPIFNEFLSSFGNWLLPFYGEGLRFQVNQDKIGALEAMRTRLFDRMIKGYQADVLTRDEVREALGYEPLGDDEPEPEDREKALRLIAYGE